jgi:hypothetical protein
LPIFIDRGAPNCHHSIQNTEPFAHLQSSAEMKFVSGVSLAATFEGEFSDVTRSYAGKGVARYQW